MKPNPVNCNANSCEEIKLALHREKSLSELKIMSSQLNPHFIFNALNSIQYRILEGETLSALEFIGNFSKLMRQVLNNSLKPFISLKDEIDFLESYINLERQRKDSDFEYSIEYENCEIEELMLPPMMLQPFVENAIIHAMPFTKKGKLRIAFSLVKDMLQCTIEDNGPGMSKERKEGQPCQTSLAIKLIKERLITLEEVCHQKSKLKITTGTGKLGGLNVLLQFPKNLKE